jgi:hypothetical protein
MKRSLVIKPVLGNNYGSLTPTVEGLVKELTESSYARIISIDDPFLMDAILDVGRSKENLIFYGWFGFDLAINGLNAGIPKPVANLVSAKQVAILDDPIFAPWVFDRVRIASSKIKFLCTAPNLVSQLREIRGVEAQIAEVDIPAPISLMPLENTPRFQDRDYDILIPCSATEQNEDLLVTRGREGFGLGDLAKLYFDAVRNNVSLTTFNRFNSFEFSRNFFFSAVPTLREKVSHPIEYPQICNFVWEVDSWVRHSFRIELIRLICQKRGLKVRVLSDSGLSIDANCDLEVSPPVRGDAFQNLLLNARYVVDIAVPGATRMHIRAKSAFAAGAAVISNNLAMGSIVRLDEVFQLDVNALYSEADWEQRRAIGFGYVNQLSYSSVIDAIFA